MLRRHIDLPEHLDYLWPELFRFQLRTHHLSPEGYDAQLDSLLSTLSPVTFHDLSYDDKLTILLSLVRSLHRLDTLKPHLLERVEEI